jgi:hypothetical protein
MSVVQLTPAAKSTIGVATRIDRIAITYDVSPPERLTLISTLKKAPFYRAGTRQYRHYARFPLSDATVTFCDPTSRADLILSAHPKLPGQSLRYGRIEFNPSRVDDYHVRYVMENVFEIPWERIQAGNVSQVHIAADIAGAAVQALSIYVPKMGVVQTFSKSGYTLYIGARTSQRMFAIYDKQAEIVKANQKVPPIYKKTVPVHPLTRVEARLKPCCPVIELLSLKNPFDDVAISATSDVITSDWVLNLAFQHSRLVGINGVLPLLPKAVRAQMLCVLQAESVNWWQPGKVWSEYIHLAQGVVNANSAPALIAAVN